MANWGQMGPNGALRGQTGPKGAKPNGAKWGQTGTNRDKRDQSGTNRAKCSQTGPNVSELVQRRVKRNQTEHFFIPYILFPTTYPIFINPYPGGLVCTNKLPTAKMIEIKSVLYERNIDLLCVVESDIYGKNAAKAG